MPKSIHQPCPDCPSSDALQTNDSGSTYCHSCGLYTPSGGSLSPSKPSEDTLGTPLPVEARDSYRDTLGLLKVADYKGLPSRGITSATAKTYGTLIRADKTYFSYHSQDSADPVAVKLALPGKQFPWIGSPKQAALFGQQLFSAGGKYVTIVEGEYDALAAFQMTGSKYPVVSIAHGAQAALKDCTAQYEWLDSFETVVICFDADDPGRKASIEVAELFGGKSKIVKLQSDKKDACGYLCLNKGLEFNNTWWKAEKFVPDGIVNGDTLWDDVKDPAVPAEFQYPWPRMNGKTFGLYAPSLVTVGAGSGVGKSQFIKEIIYQGLRTLPEENIGVLSLEEGNPVTGLGLMSLHANLPLHIPGVEASTKLRRQAFEATLGTGRIYMLNHFGSYDITSVLSRCKYLVKGLQCRTLFIDHVSIIVSAQNEKDERKAIDELMTKLRMLVEETGIRCVLVSHLNRPSSGPPHEEGGHTSATQFRGSGSIVHLSDLVLGLERDSQADDSILRNTTKIRVIKSRKLGLTGIIDSLYYNPTTGRMTEVIEEVL
jgi:twinkle protein